MTSMLLGRIYFQFYWVVTILGASTFRIMTINLMTHNITSIRIMTVNILILSIIRFRRMTFST
jgi:hypothetical protein